MAFYRQLESEIGRLRNDKDSVGKELALKQHETQAKLKNANEIENKIRALQKELLMLKREYRELDTTETDNSQMFMMVRFYVVYRPKFNLRLNFLEKGSFRIKRNDRESKSCCTSIGI